MQSTCVVGSAVLLSPGVAPGPDREPLLLKPKVAYLAPTPEPVHPAGLCPSSPDPEAAKVGPMWHASPAPRQRPRPAVFHTQNGLCWKVMLPVFPPTALPGGSPHSLCPLLWAPRRNTSAEKDSQWLTGLQFRVPALTHSAVQGKEAPTLLLQAEPTLLREFLVRSFDQWAATCPTKLELCTHTLVTSILTNQSSSMTTNQKV